jgi:hypothetical protein
MEAALEAPRVTSLSHEDPSTAISLAGNVSESHLGAILQQWSPKGWQPLSFYSKKLDELKKVQYSTFDREQLEAYLAVWYFRFLLEGKQFHNETEYKLLTFPSTGRPSCGAFGSSISSATCWSLHTSDLCHMAGAGNVVLDSPSGPLLTE